MKVYIKKRNPMFVFILLYSLTALQLWRPHHLFGNEEYFHCCLNQMPKPVSYSSCVLKIEKARKYGLNYSDDLLVKRIGKFDILSCKVASHFLNTAFSKLVYTYFVVFVGVKQKLRSKKIEPCFTFVCLGLGWQWVLQYCVFLVVFM